MPDQYLVRVDFLDHCDSSAPDAGLMPCTVWGILVFENDTELHVLKWCATSNPSDANSECWSIAKHEGIQIERIRLESSDNRLLVNR